MDWRKFVIALIGMAAAFYLYAKHLDGGGTFLALLGGSPLAAEAGRHLVPSTDKAVLDPEATLATPASSGDAAG